MATPPASMRNLARQLLAVEAASQSGTDTHVHQAVRVFEKLRLSLVRLTGSEGFAALLRRSLALARVEVPALELVTINTDCSIQGLEELAADTTNGGIDGLGAMTANLLGLLATFIGEPLTLRVVRDGWPDASFDEYLPIPRP